MNMWISIVGCDVPVTHSQLSKRRWVVRTAIRQLYLRERNATRYTGGWVGPRAGLEGTEHLAHTGTLSPNRPAVASRYTGHAIQLSSRDTID
jgi:hypothetical protein